MRQVLRVKRTSKTQKKVEFWLVFLLYRNSFGIPYIAHTLFMKTCCMQRKTYSPIYIVGE